MKDTKEQISVRILRKVFYFVTILFGGMVVVSAINGENVWFVFLIGMLVSDFVGGLLNETK